MGKLVIDVTQLVNWTGRLTGVPRVMDELSVRFAQEYEGCVFVEWDGVRQEFYQVDFIAARDARNAEPVATPATAPARASGAKTLVKKLENHSWVVRQGMRAPRKALRAVRNRRPAPAVIDNRVKIQPVKGDMLLILCDWHESLLVDRAVKLHSEGVKLSTVAYDMLPIVTPQYSGHATERLTYFGTNIYPRCEVLFSISQHTKKDVTEWLKQLKLKVPRIDVFRLGDDFQATKPVRPKEAAFAQSKLKGQDYLLCVGTIEARKNHTLLYYTYKLAHQRGIELPKIVVVGRRGWRTEDMYELITTDPQTKDKFVMLHNVSDEEQSWLYQHCLFSVYPSFYEGWGLPIAESVSRGVPMACSNTSSMPEVAGDLVSYFSPVSTDECLAAIQGLLKPKELERARKRAKKYKLATWDEAFNEVHNVLKEVYGGTN